MDGEAGEESAKQWRRVRIFLELLQHKANISDAHTLVPTLFVLLARWVSWWFSWGNLSQPWLHALTLDQSLINKLKLQ